MNNWHGSASAKNPGRFSTITVDGFQISGDCLIKKAVAFPIGTDLFLTESGQIVEDPQVFYTPTPEVQYFGRVVKDDYILVAPKRLPVGLL